MSGFSFGGSASPTAAVPSEAAATRKSALASAAPTMEGNVDLATGSASAAFASLAHSYSQLLDCMENPHEHNVTPKEMGDLLVYLSPRFLSILTIFAPIHSETTNKLQTGIVKSSFPNETAASLGVGGSTGSVNGQTDSTTLNLSELIHFYYSERSSLLRCIAALFRIFLDSAHPYHSASVGVLTDLVSGGLEKSILDQYKRTCQVTMPKAPLPNAFDAQPKGDASDAPSQSTMFMDDPVLATLFADQNVQEQALLMEVLFLLYYENDAFTQERALLDDGAKSTPSDAQTRFFDVYSLLHTHQFGRVQPLYPFLSARGRATVDWIGQLSILIGLELMAFEKLLRVYNHPIQEIKAVLQQHQTASEHCTPEEAMDKWQANRDAAMLILHESDLTFKEHPFHDLAFLAKVDSAFFETAWNPRLQREQNGHAGQVMATYYAPLNIAWAVALSQVYEYLEDVQSIQFDFGLHPSVSRGVDGSVGVSVDDLGRTNFELQDFQAEKQIIIARLENSLNGSGNPFQVLNSILTRVANVARGDIATGSDNGYAIEHAASNLPAFKEIGNEFLNALFQSSCYSALLSFGSSSSLGPIFPLFNTIFRDDSALAYRFWKVDQEHPEDRSPLFDTAIEQFPVEPAPFIDLLTALTGQTSTSSTGIRFGASGETFDTRTMGDATAADTAVCAARVFATLQHMKFCSSIVPPDSHIVSIEQQSEFNVMLTATWTTPDGIVLPARTVGRFITTGVESTAQPRFMQWWHSYSAWPLLVARLDSAWSAMRGAITLTQREWIQVVHIVQLLAKLVKAEPNLFSQLTSHLQDIAIGSSETAVTLWSASTNASSLGAAAPQARELNFVLTLMRIQAYVSLHANALLAAANASSGKAAQQANDASMIDSTMQDITTVDSSSATMLSSSHLLDLLDCVSLLLSVASKNDWGTWLRAFNLVMGGDMTSISSGLQVNTNAANLLANVSLLNTASPFQATYNYLLLFQRSLVSVQAPLNRYPLFSTLLDHLSTVLLPVYQLATIQKLRLHDKAAAYAFLPKQANVGNIDSDRTTLPVNPAFATFMESFDMHHVLKYICESVFVQYDDWRYAIRSDRWSLGSQLIRFFLLILSNPTAPPNTHKSPSTSGASLHDISIQHYLYTLFLTQPSMLLSLLRPVLFGLSLLDRLNYDRHNDDEVILLQDLLIHTFLLLKKLMNLESQHASAAGGGTVASFYGVLLETVAADHVPSAWSHTNRRRGGRFATTPNSILQAMTEYANYTRSVELQSLAIQTIRLLCISGSVGSANSHSTLAHYFTPPALQNFRRTCLQLLTAHTTELSLKVQVLQLLATMFERQPAMAQRFAVSSFLQQLQRLEGKENPDGEDNIDDDDSLFQVLKAYILGAESTFVGDPQSLLLIYRILAAIWHSSTSIGVGHFSALQTRLRTEVPGLWEKLTHCLTAEIQDAPEPASLDSCMDGGIAESDASSLSYFLSVKLLRNCVWSIINAELFQSLGFNAANSGGSDAAIDPALEAILIGFGSAATKPQRYIQFLLAYCHTSEHVSAHRASLDQLQQYHLDLAVFILAPSSEEIDDGLIRAPIYHLELITKIMQLDLDLAFEKDANMTELQLNATMTDLNTSLVIRDESRLGPTAHRTRIEQLILGLKKLNNSMLIADAELRLLQSWRSFVQICLKKQPALLGIKPKSTLAFDYVHQLSGILADERRFGQGSIMAVFVQHLSSLLLSFLASGLADGSSGGVDLSSAILIHLSRSASERNSVLDKDDRATGESVLRVTNDLLSKVASALESSLKAHPGLTHALDSNSTGILPLLASTVATPPAATNRVRAFDVTTRISTGVFAARVQSTLASSLSSQRDAILTQNQHGASINCMQSLLTSTLMLVRFANQILLQQYTSHSDVSNPVLPAVSMGGVGGGRLSSPAPVRRLDGAFGSPNGVRSALAPVMETQQSVAGSTLILSIGDEYAPTCQLLMRVVAGCAVEPKLADLAITTIPMLLQAIDVVQGASKNTGVDALMVDTDQQPIVLGLSQMQPLIPLLLRSFATMPVSQPATALKLVQLLSVIAEYEFGAEMLVQQSVVMHICHHRIFTATVPITAPGSSTPYQPSFAPYTPSNTRDAWHQVWILTVKLLSTLLRSLSAKSRVGSISIGGPLSTALSPMLTKLLEDVLSFFNIFSSTRINTVLHLAHAYQVSVGALEEIDAITRLIYDFDTYGQIWHRVNENLYQTQRQQMLLLTTYYMRLLNDHRELEKRILVVSPDEKACAVSDDDGDSSKSDSGAPLARAVSSDADPRPIDRQKSDLSSGLVGGSDDRAALRSLEEKKKSVWRPLGSSSGIGSGTSTPHQLSTPTTPRSIATPASITPGPEEKAANLNEAIRNNLNATTMLSPVRQTSSFLLRSPVVGSLLNQTDSGHDLVGTGSISGAVAADAKHAEATTQKGFAFFIQKIEYSMCLILRNCTSYLRLQSQIADDDEFRMRDILFSHRIKVVNVSTSLSSFTGVSPAPSSAMLLLVSPGIDSASPFESGRVGVTPRDKIIQIFTGLGIGVEEEAHKQLAEVEFESDYYNVTDGDERPTSPNDAPYTFRPPMAMLIDFTQYTVSVLTKLFDVQKQNGLLDSLDSIRPSQSVDHAASSRPSSSHFLPHWSHLQRVSRSSGPTIVNIHSAMQFLLETTLYIFTRHVMLHIAQLKKAQLEYLAQMPHPTQAVQHQPTYFGYAQTHQTSQPVEATQPIVPPAAIRIGKLLEQYRERINQLVESLARYMHLIAADSPSPPALSATPLTHLTVSRLVSHLTRILEDAASTLGKHIAAARHIIKAGPTRTNEPSHPTNISMY